MPFKCELKKDPADLQDYAKKIFADRKLQNLSDQNLQIVITDYALDHWLSQIFDVDMNDIDKVYVKGHCGNKEIYEYLQHKYRHGIPYTPGATYADRWAEMINEKSDEDDENSEGSEKEQNEDQRRMRMGKSSYYLE